MPPDQKVLLTEQQGETLIVRPQGLGLGFRYADLQTESNNICQRLSKSDVSHLVVDLGGLDYFGSEVIGVFIKMARDVTNRGGRVALCGASDKMREVLENMNLFRLWPHFPSREEALQSVQLP